MVSIFMKGNLINYVDKAKKAGIPLHEIKDNLLKNGWSLEQVNSVLRNYSSTEITSNHMSLINFKNFILFFLGFVLIFGLIVFFILNDSEKKISLEELDEGVYFSLAGKPVILQTNSGELKLVYSKTIGNRTLVRINGALNSFNISDSKDFDVDKNGIYDLRLNLTKIIVNVPKFYAVSENVSLVEN